MKKAYEAPKIAVENFVLNPFTAAIIAAGQFAGMLNCSLNADDDNDTLCYHTQGSPLFTS